MRPTRPVILYVEDEPRSRRVMEMIVRDLDLGGLYLFEDSTAFIERALLLAPPPDVIFLDIHVRPLSGFEMLALLRAQAAFERTPIVAMTASVMSEEVRQLQQAGFDGCLAKPLDLDSFPELLDRILQGEHLWRILT